MVGLFDSQDAGENPMKQREISYLTNQVRERVSEVESRFEVPPEPDLNLEIVKAIQNVTAKLRTSAAVVQSALEETACSCSRYGTMSDLALKHVFREPPSYREAMTRRKQALKRRQADVAAVQAKAQEIIDGINLGQYDGKNWRQPILDIDAFIESRGGTVE